MVHITAPVDQLLHTGELVALDGHKEWSLAFSVGRVQRNLAMIMKSKVWQNLTIPAQEASECFIFFSSPDIKLHFEGKLDSVQYIFAMQIFEFTKSLSLANN